MTNTVSEAHAQSTSAEPLNTATREAKRILGAARFAIDAIEGWVDDLNTAMTELLLLANDLPDDQSRAEVKMAANDLGAKANEMVSDLDCHLEDLHKEVIAAAADVEDEDED